jgi:hypothetical protein
MKADGGVDVQIHVFLTFDNSWWLAISFIFRPLYPQGNIPRYPLGRVGPRTGLDDLGKRKNFLPTRSRTPTLRLSSLLPVVIQTVLSPLRIIIHHLGVRFSQRWFHVSFLLAKFLDPKDGCDNLPPKRRLNFAELHRVISQKRDLFIRVTYNKVSKS